MVEFQYEKRYDAPKPFCKPSDPHTDNEVWGYFTTRLLTDIRVRQGGQLAAGYKLRYDHWGDAVTCAAWAHYALKTIARCSDENLTTCLPGWTLTNSMGSDNGRLESFNNGYGGQVAFGYTLLAYVDGYHQYSGGNANEVVTTRTVLDTVTNTANQWSFSYAGAYLDGQNPNKYVVGYAQATETLPASLGAGNTTYHHFISGNGVDTVFRGKEDQQIATVGGVKQQEVTRVWASTTTGVYGNGKLVYLSEEVQKTYDTNGQNPLARKTAYFYDLDYQGGAQYGNATRIAAYANATDATPYRTTLNRYYPNTTAWIVNKPAFTNVYAGAVPAPPAAPDVSQLAASTWFIYSDDQENPAPSWNQPVGSKGQLRGVRRYQGQDTGGNHQYVDVRYRHDAFGNVTEERAYRSYGAANAWANMVANTVATSYDTAFAAYPLSVTVTPGTGAGATLITSNRYYGINAEAGGSGSVGQLQSVTDPNGAVTRYQYDVFGRPQAEARPGDTLDIPTLNYAYYDAEQPFRIVTAVRETSGCGGCNHPSVTFYDGLGQVIQTKTEAQDGSEMIVTDTRYNALGLVQDQYMPYKLNNATTFWNYVGLNTAQPKTSTVYDALGRVRVVTAPDGSRNETWYTVEHDTTQPVDPDFAEPRLSVYSIDANSHFVRRTHDAFGNLRSVSEFTGIWGQPDLGTESRTRYAYDVTGRLTDVWDAVRPTPNHTQIGYDRLGRKEQMSDPDMGTWSYAYDTAGNLTRQTDARKQTICFFYDELNRLTGKSYQTTTACPTGQPASPVVSYTYDYRSVLGNEQNMGIGRRTGMTDQTGSTGWVYDARGRVTREKKTVDGTTYSSRYTYRADDQVETTIYPDGEVVTTGYDNRRLPVSLSGALGTYVSSSSYDAEGRLDLRVVQSDGLQTDYVYYAWNVGQGFGGRLNQILSGVGNGSTGLQNLAYAYDKAGNTTRIRDDNNSGQRQCLRLRSAEPSDRRVHRRY